MSIATDRREGVVPTPDSPFVADLLAGMDAHMRAHRAAAYGEGEDESDERPMAREGAVYRHSWSTACARQLGYHMSRTPESNPSGIVDRWGMHLGTLIHETIDRALEAAGWPADSFEVVCGYDEPIRTAGHADACRDNGHRTVAEYKSQTDFSYRRHIGATLPGNRQPLPADGPAWDAIAQGSLNAVALDADELVILDAAKALISKPAAQRQRLPDSERAFAPWHFSRDTPIDAPGGELLTFPEIAERTLRRIVRVHELVVAGELPEREIDDPELPVGAVIQKPMTGQWEQGRRNYWRCSHYCPFRDQCDADLRAGR